MQFPITIGLHRSRFLERALIVIASAAGCAIFAFPVPLAFQIALIIAVGASLLAAWRRLSPTLAAVRLARDGTIMAACAADSEFCSAGLRTDATVHPWLTVFRLQLDGRQHTVVLARDSLPEDDFRRLRVFLRWQAQFSAADDDRGAPCS